jgi:hypothetical protein
VLLWEPIRLPAGVRIGSHATSCGAAGFASESTTVPSSPGWHALLRVSIAITAYRPSGEIWTSFWPPGQSNRPATFGTSGLEMSITVMPPVPAVQPPGGGVPAGGVAPVHVPYVPT